MIELWIGIAILTVLGVLAVAFPLIGVKRQIEQTALDRKSQNIEIFKERLAELDAELAMGNLSSADYELLVLELKKGLLVDAEGLDDEPSASTKVVTATKSMWMVSSLISCVLVVSALSLYNHYGSAGDLRIALTTPDPSDMSIDEAIAQLEEELQERPDNAEGWYMLATTYIGMGRFDEGLSAFRTVIDQLDETSQPFAKVMGEYTQALFLAKGNSVDDEVRAQIDKTLSFNPNDVNALSIQGVDAFANGDYQMAITHWQKALQFATGETSQSLKGALETAQSRVAAESGVPPLLSKPAGEQNAAAQVADAQEVAASITVAVSLSADLVGQAQPDDTVFIFARPVGGRMPLAAVRLTVADLPITITLDANSAMSPQATLDAVDIAEVAARISFSGQPTPQSGDLFGMLESVSTREGVNTKQLVIDRVVD